MINFISKQTMKNQPIFTQQIYTYNEYRNPAKKIRQSFIKKSFVTNADLVQQKKNLSLDQYANNDKVYQLFKETTTNTDQSQGLSPCIHLKNNLSDITRNDLAVKIQCLKQSLSKIHKTKIHLSEQDEVKILKYKNQSLIRQLNDKNICLDDLKSKYEKLQSKLQIFSNKTTLNSADTSLDSSRMGCGKRRKHICQLIQIRDKLKDLDFNKLTNFKANR